MIVWIFGLMIGGAAVAVFAAIIGRTASAIGVAAASAVIAFLVAKADWQWSDWAAYALGAAAAIFFGRGAYFVLSSDAERAKIMKGRN